MFFLTSRSGVQTRLKKKCIALLQREKKERESLWYPNHFNMQPCFSNYFWTHQSRRGSWLIGLHIPIDLNVLTCSMQTTISEHLLLNLMGVSIYRLLGFSQELDLNHQHLYMLSNSDFPSILWNNVFLNKNPL